MSMSPFNKASSISLVKSPFPPISASGWFKILSPVVFIMTISSAPSSASSEYAAFNLSRVWYACANANGLPFLPHFYVTL